MSRWLALAVAQEHASDACDSVTKPDKTHHDGSEAGFVTFCQLSQREVSLVEADKDAFEERAAIAEYDAGITRAEAEDFAARAQGYNNVVEFRRAISGDAA